MSREPIRHRPKPLNSRRCLLKLLWGISHRFQRLSPCGGQVAHALRTLAPVAAMVSSLTPRAAPRLACVKPAASVHPEPGSNSSLYNNLYNSSPTRTFQLSLPSHPHKKDPTERNQRSRSYFVFRYLLLYTLRMLTRVILAPEVFHSVFSMIFFTGLETLSHPPENRVSVRLAPLEPPPFPKGIAKVRLFSELANLFDIFLRNFSIFHKKAHRDGISERIHGSQSVISGGRTAAELMDDARRAQIR